MGGLAFGGLTLGIVSYGGCALGLLAIGGLAIGLAGAFAGLAIGGFAAVGGLAIGYFAHGGGVIGEHVLGPMRQDPEAVRFFKPWAPAALSSFAIWNSVIIAISIAISAGLPAWAKRTQSGQQGPSLPPAPVHPPGGRQGPWKLILHFAPALLLILAWWTSGLERGAVLILSVVIVATLVIRGLRARKDLPPSS